jgi:hypothetical protein
MHLNLTKAGPLIYSTIVPQADKSAHLLIGIQIRGFKSELSFNKSQIITGMPYYCHTMAVIRTEMVF